MAEKRLYVDKDELLLTFRENREKVSKYVGKESIISILFDKCKEYVLFIPVSSEKIEILTHRTKLPVVYTKRKNKAYFEEYKRDLARFAKDNNIKLTDRL